MLAAPAQGGGDRGGSGLPVQVWRAPVSRDQVNKIRVMEDTCVDLASNTHTHTRNAAIKKYPPELRFLVEPPTQHQMDVCKDRAS